MLNLRKKGRREGERRKKEKETRKLPSFYLFKENSALYLKTSRVLLTFDADNKATSKIHELNYEEAESYAYLLPVFIFVTGQYSCKLLFAYLFIFT
jgi:hypothetical protein